MAVTIRDVALTAGVSPSTVSRALSAPDRVNAATRERVLAAAQRVGYRPNRAARGLITGRTGNVGLIVPDLANPYFASVVKGAQARARESDYAVFVADTDEEAGVEPDLMLALSKQVDGLLLCSPRTSTEELAAVDTGTPIVVMNRRVSPCVVADNGDGMRQALAHLAALGHRAVGYVGGPRTSSSNAERLAGLETAAPDLGVELRPMGNFPPLFEGGVAAADIVIASGVTAAIVHNDIVAFGLMSRFVARGVAVPGDVSVVGCDDIAMSAMAHTPLTTVAMPKNELGRAAMVLLIEILNGSVQPHSVVRELPVRLIVRESTAPARTEERR
ncbi:LacI family DNA-binding transcriptional regulator [Jiangella asiatica]|uniref:LacI family transcriptional regulator n=1 Tax=Jiangella asiatica TaxID=2530372 RepID=A0A4R5CE20_9ACTN|nr:LacI family DNA-binding transcriptional regulator [Jiangella asiatica]TDD95404.1 LacI family transcriptional regulator [Jiangella asiatica]